MNFSYNGADLSRIIKSYTKDGYAYEVEYMDGSDVTYISYNEEEVEKLKGIMIAQAKERDRVFSETGLSKIPGINVFLILVSYFGFNIAEIKESTLLKIICFCLLSANVYQINTKNNKRKELKKYKLFLELLDELGEKELNSPKYTKQYKAYAKPLTIETIDSFDLKEIKSVYKTYKLEKNSKQ